MIYHPSILPIKFYVVFLKGGVRTKARADIEEGLIKNTPKDDKSSVILFSDALLAFLTLDTYFFVIKQNVQNQTPNLIITFIGHCHFTQ